MLKKPKAICLCDFDGTITLQDVYDNILTNYGEHPYASTGTAFDDGIISHFDMNNIFAKSLRSPPNEIRDYVSRTATVRVGFFEFHSFLKKQGIGFAILSGGWDLYIKDILKGYPLIFVDDMQSVLNSVKDHSRMPVACNKLTHNGSMYSFSPHPTGNARLAPDKATIAKLLRARYQVPIICIGDGSSDYGMASVSDFVFATGSLIGHCKDNGRPFMPFSTFTEVQEKIVGAINGSARPIRPKPEEKISKQMTSGSLSAQ